MKISIPSKVMSIFLLIVACSPAWAGSLTIPNTFTAGTTASASEVNANFSAVETAVDDNDSRINALQSASQSPLKFVSISQSLSVSTSRQYFTNDHLIATPPGNGFLLITANVRYNCRSDVFSQSNFGLYISTSSAVPGAATNFTYSEVYGYAFNLEGTISNGGDWNPRIMHVQAVTGGTTYHIWFGVDGANVTSPFCSMSNPKIIATFHPSGL